MIRSIVLTVAVAIAMATPAAAQQRTKGKMPPGPDGTPSPWPGERPGMGSGSGSEKKKRSSARGAFSHRLSGLRGHSTRYGATSGSLRAIDRALAWLAAYQERAGHWDTDNWDRGASGKADAGLAKGMGTWIDSGVTGLALMAFLGAGHTHLEDGKYKQTVYRALGWLLRKQAKDGLIGRRGGSYMYNHAIATIAICEAYGTTGDKRLAEPCSRALKYLLDARNPGASWHYTPRAPKKSTSVVSWCVAAVWAAKMANVKGDKRQITQAIKDTEKFIESQSELGGGTTGYSDTKIPVGYKGPTSARMNAGKIKTGDLFSRNHTPTAIAAYIRGISTRYKKRDPRMGKAAELCASNPPQWGKDAKGLSTVDFYYWYYGSMGTFHGGSSRQWKRWKVVMHKVLLPKQIKSGPLEGSWDPVGAWGILTGRVFATAMAALTLETPARYKVRYGNGSRSVWRPMPVAPR